MNSKLFIITGVIQLASATTVLVSPDETVCPGDTAIFNCSVTLSTCGVLSWSINNIAVGSFLDVTGQVGTRASNPDSPGVVATITDIDVGANNITSSLTISSAGIIVAHGSPVLCTNHNEQDQRNLVVAMIDLITTVHPTLRSASVIVTSRNPTALECATAYSVEVEPTVDSQRPPLTMNSSMNIITVHQLNFCKSNYTFRITVFDRNNNTYNDIVHGVSGDLNALNILIAPFQNGSILQWDLMRSDHPENCNVMFELMFNGTVLPLVSETQVSQEMLISAGFPFCRSTSVLVAPHVSAHGVLRNLTQTTTYLAIPQYSGPNNVRSIPRFIYKSENSTELHVEVKWDAVPFGTFGPNVEVSTATNFSWHCGFNVVGTSQQGLRFNDKCNSSTEHVFPVSDQKPFGKTFFVSVRLDYFECKNLASVSSVTVTAAIISFPKLIVKDRSVNITLNVNTTLVPDGSNVSIDIPSIKMERQNPVTGGKFITLIGSLQPNTSYTYMITIFKAGTGAPIDQPIYGQFITKESKLNLYVIIPSAIAGTLMAIYIVVNVVIACYIRYHKHRTRGRKQSHQKDSNI